MLPNYLVIGAQKSATSSVCDLLGQHPDVFMTDPKEPFFFSHDEIYAKGLAWYESLFENAAGAIAAGEGSTTYTQHGLYPRAAERIAEHVPDAKLVFVARDPLERIRSHWMHLRSKGGRETRPLAEAVRHNPAYIDHSLYHAQLARYTDRTGPERAHVMFFEDFKRDAEGEMRRCFEFLGADPAKWSPTDAGEARHRSDTGRADTAFMRPLRKIPGFERLRDFAPSGARESLRRILKKPVGDRPEWTPESRAWVLEQLRDDTAAFLAACGKPADYWAS